jgi:hypothetical protein
MMRGRRAWPLLSAVGLLVVSCTASSTPPIPSPPPPPGALLSVTVGPDGTSLVRYRLADGAASIEAAPIDSEAVNRGTLIGASASDGTLILAANASATQLYDTRVEDAAATPVGPGLPIAARLDPLLALGARAAVVADCRTVWILPLPHARRWIPTGDGCWAAPAPEVDAVVFSPDGHRVVERDSAGALAPILDVRDLRGSLGTRSTPSLVGTPAWGPAGLAFMVRAGDQFAAFVREGDGTIAKVLQEKYANVFRVPHIAWQPGGRLLAVADDVSPTGPVLRLFDPAGRSTRTLMLSPIAFAGIAWAPDGSSIAALTGTGQLVIVGLDGRWLLRRDTDWDQLLGWSEEG